MHRMAPLFSHLCRTPPLLSALKSHHAFLIKTSNLTEFHSRNLLPMKIAVRLCTASALLRDSSSSSLSSRKATKKARRDAPESVLRHKLNSCSENVNLIEALRLYDEARADKVPLNVHHYNILLYLCTAGLSNSNEGDGSSGKLGLERGFEIYKQMGLDNVAPNEATFTNAARLAAAKEDPEMAFDLVKQMQKNGIVPKLRSYGPALLGFCRNLMAEKAYKVDAHMIQTGVLAEEPELLALLKLSYEVKRPEKVYEILHRMRTIVRQVSEETARVVEDWFKSKTAEEVGKENWDEEKVKQGILKGGGGWHGQGWLGKGKWEVVRTEMDETGVCRSCGEKLICIDIDPKETENFGYSLAKLACEKEVKADFVQFQAWLKEHGPFDAVVDGANVSLVNQAKFSFLQLKSVVIHLREMSPSKKLPLVILHTSRVRGGPATIPINKKFLENLKKAGALYSTPLGSNDDWYWLYAAVNSKCLLVTNDEMRDHLFQLLGTSFFPRWKEKHQVRLTPAKPGLNLIMPPPYSKVIQESEKGSWHIPTVTGDDLEEPKQWLCSTRRSVSSFADLLEDVDDEVVPPANPEEPNQETELQENIEPERLRTAGTVLTPTSAYLLSGQPDDSSGEVDLINVDEDQGEKEDAIEPSRKKKVVTPSTKKGRSKKRKAARQTVENVEDSPEELPSPGHNRLYELSDQDLAAVGAQEFLDRHAESAASKEALQGTIEELRASRDRHREASKAKDQEITALKKELDETRAKYTAELQAKHDEYVAENSELGQALVKVRAEMDTLKWILCRSHNYGVCNRSPNY